MKIFRIWAAGVVIIGSTPVSAGTATQAKAVRTAYEKAVEAWEIKIQLAETDNERRQLAKERPETERAARQMWAVIRNDLEKDWIVEPAAWFLRIAGNLVRENPDGGKSRTMAEEIARLRGAIQAHHVNDARLAPICLALVSLGDPPSLKLLRVIEKNSPHEKVSGVAALCIAMMLKDTGDDNVRLIQERLTMIRKAIIHAADVEVDGVKMADIAEEELYIINNLTEGRTAPPLAGKDSGGRAMSLADYEDRVVVLIFWNSESDGALELLQWVERIRRDERFRDAPFEVVGVCGASSERLRELQRRQKIDWPNFSDPDGELAERYRVGVRPLAYVLGPGRKIQYVGPIGTFAELTAAAVLDDL
jgi:peroxiredoxin